MAKKKKAFFEEIFMLIMALGLFMPTLAYCFSQDAQDYYCSDNRAPLVVKPTQDYFVPNNPLNSIVDQVQKDTLALAKQLWIACVLDNQVQIACANVQIKATQNSLEPPEQFKFFLIFHYLNKYSDFFL